MHHAQLTEAVNPFNPNAQQMYSQLEGMGMTEQQASGWLAQQITNQGLIISANEIFWISAGIFIVLLGLVWFAKPPFGAGMGAVECTSPVHGLPGGATLTGPTNVGRIRRSRHPANHRTVSKTRQRLSVPIKQRA